MAYALQEAKELVIKAGLKLVESGLVARTWGNISARVSPPSLWSLLKAGLMTP